MSKLSTQQRHALILDVVTRKGECRLEELSQLVQVSIATMRRDIATLESRGLVERTWGGVCVATPVKYLPSFLDSSKKHAAEKRAIAAVAASLVQPGMVIGLSGGSSCTELARWLRGKKITVVTNALNVAMELYSHGHTKVIVAGGHLNMYSYELVGDNVRQTLQEHRLDLAFLGCTGITPEFGFSMRDEPEAIAARVVCHAAERCYVLADHSKVGRHTLTRFATVRQVTALITDDGVQEQQRVALENAGLKVLVAPALT